MVCGHSKLNKGELTSAVDASLTESPILITSSIIKILVIGERVMVWVSLN